MLALQPVPLDFGALLDHKNGLLGFLLRRNNILDTDMPQSANLPVLFNLFIFEPRSQAERLRLALHRRLQHARLLQRWRIDARNLGHAAGFFQFGLLIQHFVEFRFLVLRQLI